MTTAEKDSKKALKTLEKSSKLILLFFTFILFSQIIFAEENITITAEVKGASTINWLYSEETKQIVVGSAVTVFTILIGMGVYYLIKLK